MSNQYLSYGIRKLIHLPSGIRRRWYKNFNRWKFRLLGVTLGDHALIHNKVYLHKSGTSIVTIGSHFVINSGDNLNPLCRNVLASIYVEPHAKLIIGNHFGMSGGTIWCTQSISIGNHVNIGGNCSIMDGDMHNIDWQLRQKDRNEAIPYKSLPVVIEDDVWVGAHCIILKGVIIGARSIIAAGSVVTHSIPADSIAAGNPCCVIKSLKT